MSEDGKILGNLNVLDILHANDLQRYVSRAYPSVYLSKSRRIFKAVAPSLDLTRLNNVGSRLPPMMDEYTLFEASELLVSLRKVQLVFVELENAKRTCCDLNTEEIESKFCSSDASLQTLYQ